MAALNYTPVCGCGNPVKVFASSGRAAKACDDTVCRSKAVSRKPQRPNHPCVDCGKPIWRGSVRCLACARARKAIKQRQCSGCGKTFKPKLQRHGSYCSRECAYNNVKKWNVRCNLPPCEPEPEYSPIADCAQCGHSFVRNKKWQKYCTKACAKQVAYYEPKPAREIDCQVCGKRFLVQGSGSGRRQYCSDKCGRLSVKREPGSNWTKRKLGMTARQWQRLRLRVLVRDDYICGICGTRTDPLSNVNADNYPNVDHIVPRSVSNDHDMSNLRCACRACNLLKGDKIHRGGYLS